MLLTTNALILKTSKLRARVWNRESALVGVLGILTVLSRIPFQSRILDSTDAVNYALALHQFNISLHQPQPPGYPVYILLGRALNLILQNDLASLVWLSAIFSGLSVVMLYLVGRRLFNPKVGLIGALLLASSTAFWLQGEIPAPYAIDFFASTLVGWLCYRLMVAPGTRITLVSAATVGLAGAFRPQTIVFLFPLFLFSMHRLPWRAILGAIFVAGVVFAFFFVPAVMISGGPVAYVNAMEGILPIFRSQQTLANSVSRSRYLSNLYTVARYSLGVLGEFAVPFVAIGYLASPSRVRFWRDKEMTFLLVWLIPTWVAYILVWPGNQGTILICMPPLLVLAARGLGWLTESTWGRRLGWTLLILDLIWQITVFTAMPPYPFGNAYRRFDTHQLIAQLDESLRTKLALLARVPAAGTIVYAVDYRILQYYLPHYRVFSPPSLRSDNPRIVKTIAVVQDGKAESWSNVDVTTLIPEGTERVVAFDLPPAWLLASYNVVADEQNDQYRIYVIPVLAGHRLVWTQAGLTAVSP
jgi:Dolichyl-phosphate-mannose-protein mannosyltransferase